MPYLLITKPKISKRIWGLDTSKLSAKNLLKAVINLNMTVQIPLGCVHSFVTIEMS